jgi:hypothetical protein
VKFARWIAGIVVGIVAATGGFSTYGRIISRFGVDPFEYPGEVMWFVLLSCPVILAAICVGSVRVRYKYIAVVTALFGYLLMVALGATVGGIIQSRETPEWAFLLVGAPLFLLYLLVLAMLVTGWWRYFVRGRT